MIKLILISSISLLFSGCIGIGFIHQKDTNVTENIGKRFESMLYNNCSKKNDLNNTVYICKKDSYDWKGVVPMIGVGIPIAIPVGYNKDVYYVDEYNIITKEIHKDTSWNGFMCGVLNENGDTGCSFLK